MVEPNPAGRPRELVVEHRLLATLDELVELIQRLRFLGRVLDLP